jgi:hydroxymethylbilane synthase
MTQTLRIGTRDSQLAVWQSTWVQQLLAARGIDSTLVMIKSDGDINLHTPLYEMGVQGIFTKTLDIALLEEKIDLAVHSMKDVPVVLAKGIRYAAVLERASYKDILVYKDDIGFLSDGVPATIASSSIRRIAQWRHRYPHHEMVSLRGNVNTRLRKLAENNWQGAIFAAAGLERIGLRPANTVDLDWMLPAPAQGAVTVVCRASDNQAFDKVHALNHQDTELCTYLERSFLRTLQGGCSSPVSALATINEGQLQFTGSIASHDGSHLETVSANVLVEEARELGIEMAKQILASDKAWIKMVLKPQ